MVNREYIKSQIDALPESVVAAINNYIDKSKRNAEYLAKLDQSRKEIEEGRGIEFTVEELENITEMPIEEAKTFAADRAAKKGLKLWQ